MYTQLNPLASLTKWLSVRLRNKWFLVQIPLLSVNSSQLEKGCDYSQKKFFQLYQFRCPVYSEAVFF